MQAETWAAIDADPLAFLVDDPAAFLKQHWEQAPVVFKASAGRRRVFADLFSFAELLRLARICEDEGQPLAFGLDINAARYVSGERETPNGELADAAAVERLYHKEGCTMQFHQPQRFVDELWRLLAALERQLGCLVGCNAYLTPKGTQGLAPHWDDVELLVVQTEGSKRWRLYRPAAAQGAPTGPLQRSHLANHVSGDLAQDEIGQPVMEVVLEVGDVLYLPRGTIHQAAAQDAGSSHLTVSTYQRWSAADLLQYTVSVALANAQLQPLLPLPLKAGLPLNWLSAASMGASDAGALAAAACGMSPGELAHAGGFGPDAPKVAGSVGGRAALAAQLAAACRSMADSLEDAELGPRLLMTAGDAMAEDFMRSRLPPHPEQLPPLGPPPTLEDSVQCVGASLFRLVAFKGTDEEGCGSDCEEDHNHRPGHAHPIHSHDEGGCGDDCEDEHGAAPGHGAGPHQPPAFVRLVSCLLNNRDCHMLNDGGDEGSEDEEGSSDSDDDGSDDMGSKDAEDAVAGISKAVAAAVNPSGPHKRKQQEEAAAEIVSDDSDAASHEESEEDGEEEQEDGGEEQEDFVFPAEMAPALVQLLDSAADARAAGGSGQPVRVRNIALPDTELQMQLATALWDAGVLHTVKAAPKQQKKQAVKQQRRDGGKKAGRPAAPKPKKLKA